MHSIYTPVRVAAAIARAAADCTPRRAQLGGDAAELTRPRRGDHRRRRPHGRRSASSPEARAVTKTRRGHAPLKPRSQLKLVGTPQRRIDAHEIVTGRKQFAMDLEVPGALPTMVCRPPTINGTALERSTTARRSRRCPGSPTSCSSRTRSSSPAAWPCAAQTFGQCIDAIRALNVDWGPGIGRRQVRRRRARRSQDRRAAADPGAARWPSDRADVHVLLPPRRPAGDQLRRRRRATPDSAEIWSSLKSPIWAKEQIAEILGLPLDNVTVHVTQGGGSFGRHLFCDAAFEAAAISQTLGKPVKLMWHRTDNFRQGRVHPMCTSRVRVTYSGDNVLAFDQRHTSVATDFTQGLGELLSAMAATLPEGELPRLLGGDLHADRERALQLRRGHPAAQRDLRVQHVQHRAACATSTARRCAPPPS